VETIKRLNREVVRLESFKRNLMQTLTDDEVRGQGGARPAMAASSQPPSTAA
jgi:hypothetical protein